MTAEHFIPLRKSDLIRRLAGSAALSPAERDSFSQLSHLLSCRFHYDFHCRLEALKDVYAALDPDADTVPDRRDECPQERDLKEFFQQVGEVLERANYQRLSRAELEASLDASSDWGVRLHVDFGAFERLEVYARGEVCEARTQRSWRTWFRRVAVELPLHQRLVIVFRLNVESDSTSKPKLEPVYLKMFKDIPRVDVETLLPAARVKMTLFDHGRIFFPTASGAAVTIYKIFKGALTLAYAGFYGMLAFLGLVGGTIGYGVKSFFGYMRARDKYRLHLTQNLYYQNLDNNTGVLCRLIDEAEEQECREACLAYFLLWQQSGRRGWTQKELDEACEIYLRQQTGMEIDFEVGDALAKLERLRLVERTMTGNLAAVPIQTALLRLDEDWDGFFQFDQTVAAAA